MKNYNFSVVIEKDDDGFYAFCPWLQGCYSQGSTYEEAMENIKDAIKLHLEDRILDKEKMPTIGSLSLSSVSITI